MRPDSSFNSMSMWSMYFRRPGMRPVLAALNEMTDAQARAKVLPRKPKTPDPAPLFESAAARNGGEHL